MRSGTRGAGGWVSDAEVAEIQYTAFTSKKKDEQVTARLIVRRVKTLNKKAADVQGELFPAWRYHAVFTDSPFTMLQAKEQHRDHAIVEQVFADWNSGPLGHMPSGDFNANAAWTAIAAMTQNLLRAAGVLAEPLLRQGPHRHDPPRHHRRRRPHRPPRTREPHPPPARTLAPRARVDQPVDESRRRRKPPRRRHRGRPPPRPDQPRPVRTPTPARHTDPDPDPETRTSR